MNNNYMEKNFYKYKDGTYCPIYRKDINDLIDVFQPQTILPWCKIFNIPFIVSEWCHLLYKKLLHGKELNGSIFGQYLTLMKLQGWRNFTFKNSDDINRTERFIPIINWGELDK